LAPVKSFRRNAVVIAPPKSLSRFTRARGIGASAMSATASNGVDPRAGSPARTVKVSDI
jgi:hypothetical protein